jgi:hypothetical protein
LLEALKLGVKKNSGYAEPMKKLLSLFCLTLFLNACEPSQSEPPKSAFEALLKTLTLIPQVAEHAL